MITDLPAQIGTTFDSLIETFSEIPDEKINVVPFASSWTPGQLIQHLILSMSGFEKLINGEEAEAGRPYDQSVDETKKIFESSKKMNSPKELEPELKAYDQGMQMKDLKDLKIALMSAVTRNRLTKLATSFEFAGGNLTKYEAACFLLYHTQRHTRQLKDIQRYI